MQGGGTCQDTYVHATPPAGLRGEGNGARNRSPGGAVWLHMAFAHGAIDASLVSRYGPSTGGAVPNTVVVEIGARA